MIASPLDYLSTVALTAGAHPPGGAVCAMEALALALVWNTIAEQIETGEHLKEKTP